jgi:hypothetical protein
LELSDGDGNTFVAVLEVSIVEGQIESDEAVEAGAAEDLLRLEPFWEQ